MEGSILLCYIGTSISGVRVFQQPGPDLEMFGNVRKPSEIGRRRRKEGDLLKNILPVKTTKMSSLTEDDVCTCKRCEDCRELLKRFCECKVCVLCEICKEHGHMKCSECDECDECLERADKLRVCRQTGKCEELMCGKHRNEREWYKILNSNPAAMAEFLGKTEEEVRAMWEEADKEKE